MIWAFPVCPPYLSTCITRGPSSWPNFCSLSTVALVNHTTQHSTKHVRIVIVASKQTGGYPAIVEAAKCSSTESGPLTGSVPLAGTIVNRGASIAVCGSCSCSPALRIDNECLRFAAKRGALPCDSRASSRPAARGRAAVYSLHEPNQPSQLLKRCSEIELPATIDPPQHVATHRPCLKMTRTARRPW